MRAERVVDASVLAAALFDEKYTPQARSFIATTERLVAPDHLHAEIASVSAKKVWRGEIRTEEGVLACRAVSAIVEQLEPSAGLGVRAFELAAAHRFSAYDGLYLALAERTGVPVFTVDLRFARRAEKAGLGRHVEIPDDLTTG